MSEREFDASVEMLYAVLDFIEDELEKLGCPAKAKMQFAVSAEEIFVNIAHYAYPEKPGRASVAVWAAEGGAALRFSDCGVPFDPLARKDPDVTLSSEERQIGGLGIYMVKQTMDEVRYVYENGHNILTMQKRF